MFAMPSFSLDTPIHGQWNFWSDSWIYKFCAIDIQIMKTRKKLLKYVLERIEFILTVNDSEANWKRTNVKLKETYFCVCVCVCVCVFDFYTYIHTYIYIYIYIHINVSLIFTHTHKCLFDFYIYFKVHKYLVIFRYRSWNCDRSIHKEEKKKQQRIIYFI